MWNEVEFTRALCGEAAGAYGSVNTMTKLTGSRASTTYGRAECVVGDVTANWTGPGKTIPVLRARHHERLHRHHRRRRRRPPPDRRRRFLIPQQLTASLPGAPNGTCSPTARAARYSSASRTTVRSARARSCAWRHAHSVPCGNKLSPDYVSCRSLSECLTARVPDID